MIIKKQVKERIEKALNIKIKINDNIIVEGEGFSEYIARLVLSTLEFGFSLDSALKLKDENFMLEKINLKEYARKAKLNAIKGRIIGQQGKAIKTISMLSGCDIKMHDNTVALLGITKNVIAAKRAILSLVRGARHSHAYKTLEESKEKRKAEEGEGGEAGEDF